MPTSRRQTPRNTNGTSMAIDDNGNMDVVWTGSDGVYYATAPATGGVPGASGSSTTATRLTLAGPIEPALRRGGRPGRPWVAYTVVAHGVEVRVATKKGTKWTTNTVASLKLCNGCPQPGATEDRHDAERADGRLRRHEARTR